MNTTPRRTALIMAIVWALSSQGLAQVPAPARVEGLIHDFTADLDAAGPWQIVGPWSLAVTTQTGRVQFLAALSMVRSDNAARQAHTHHVAISDGQVTPLANGYRITGNATITSNGATAAFSGSPVAIEITGGNAVTLANLKVTFGGSAVAHFGDQPLDGVVNYFR